MQEAVIQPHPQKKAEECTSALNLILGIPCLAHLLAKNPSTGSNEEVKTLCTTVLTLINVLLAWLQKFN